MFNETYNIIPKLDKSR